MNLHRIYMEPIHNGPFPLPGGWYSPGSSGATVNTFMYWRASHKEDALKLTRHEAIKIISEARGKGYPCRADPPIVVTY